MPRVALTPVLILCKVLKSVPLWAVLQTVVVNSARGNKQKNFNVCSLFSEIQRPDPLKLAEQSIFGLFRCPPPQELNENRLLLTSII